MDLNELLYRQQVSLMKADLADDVFSREVYLGEVADYAGLIADLRHSNPATPERSFSKEIGLEEWADDGGAIGSLESLANIPPIVAKTVVEYHVGNNRYTSLAHAMAQRARLTAQGPHSEERADSPR